MQDTKAIQRGLLLSLVLVALFAAAQYARIETQAARIVSLESEVDGLRQG